MPLLFCLAIHNSLVVAKAEMQVGEQLFAFLDDVNTLTTPGRTRSVCADCTRGRQGAGIGTTRAPPTCQNSGAKCGVHRASRCWAHQWGHLSLLRMSPRDGWKKRVACGRRIPSVPDLQSAWQIILQCAGPRCHHLLRTLPPNVSASCATGHDMGMQRTAWWIARRSHPEESGPHAREFAHADGRFGSEICVQDGCFVGRRDAHDL